MKVSSVHTRELGDAFGLLYGPATDNLSGHVAHAFRLVARGEINPDDILVARRNGTVVGAVYCRSLPGAIAIIWPPRAVEDDAAMEDALMNAALQHVAGVKLIQAFIPPEEVGRAAPLVRAGFRKVAQVLNLQHEGSSPTIAQHRSNGPTLIPYSDCDPSEFIDILMRCHDDSRDCPELHGIRTPAEVLAGYRDCAPDTARWWLARQGAVAVGVLILGADELVFVGVVPEYRGLGIGRALVEAVCAVAPHLSVTVDDRNTPAIQLYRSVGFRAIGARDVYFGSHDPSAGALETKSTL